MLNGNWKKEIRTIFLAEHNKTNREAVKFNAETEKSKWQEAKREDKCTPMTYRALAHRTSECVSQTILV
eukprot:1740559-Karenia_brevis.AAC.1